MKPGDMVRRSFYAAPKPWSLEEDGLGLIIDLYKPSGHRNHRCVVLWWNGKTTEQSVKILRRVS